MTLQQFIESVSLTTGIPSVDLYAVQNGRRVTSSDRIVRNIPLRWGIRLLGGKGGFGSMLRAIGAQIEKTTNREACRDLSGRRLRDIREEQRLREWAAKQPERDEEARKRKQEKIERLKVAPKFVFDDEEYNRVQQGLEEAVDAAVEHGSRVASTSKLKPEAPKRKATKLWIDDDLPEVSSSGSDEENSQSGESNQEDEVSPAKKPRLAENPEAASTSS